MNAADGFGCRAVSPGPKLANGCCHGEVCLATVSNHPVAKQGTDSDALYARLATESDCPAVDRSGRSRRPNTESGVWPGWENVGIPASATQGGDSPSDYGSPQAWIPVPTTVFEATLANRRARARAAGARGRGVNAVAPRLGNVLALSASTPRVVRLPSR